MKWVGSIALLRLMEFAAGSYRIQGGVKCSYLVDEWLWRFLSGRGLKITGSIRKTEKMRTGFDAGLDKRVSRVLTQDCGGTWDSCWIT